MTIKEKSIFQLLDSGSPDNIRLGIVLADSQGVDISKWWLSVEQIWSISQQVENAKMPDRMQLLEEVMSFKYLDWSRKRLHQFPLAVAALCAVEFLNISENPSLGLMKMAQHLRKIPNLKRVYWFSKNLLEWQNREHLQTLGMYLSPKIIAAGQRRHLGNALALMLPKLEQLFLNLHVQLSPDFSFPPTLRYLSMTHRVNIDSLPDSICDLQHLERLEVEGSVKVLPEAMGKLKNLKLLSFKNNKLFALPDSIGDCSSLEEVNINHNFIIKLPESFANLQKLHTLRLRNNPIQWSQVLPIIAQLSALQRIYIYITDISPDALQQLKKQTKAEIFTL